ncbi:uncharacterized protein LOC143057692 isoform X2 [Mytilus galloprovincialis]|uniref:uncharacterized protein LOC143057692 isoform X2 n=1 Tax=Mytilus galloprovincialis TaxID=29158 RepID=UPI003F7C9B18
MGNIVRNATFVVVLTVAASSGFLCQMELKPFIWPSLYNQDSKPVNTIGRLIKIHSADNCDLNTTDIINDYNFPNESMTVGFFVFICDEYIKISFRQLENATIISNLMSYVQLYKCSFDIEGIDPFFVITNTRVLTILTANFTSFQALDSRSSCHGSRNIQALGLNCIHNDITNFIQYMFNCNNETSKVKEILVSQCKGAINQQMLRKIFPDLQTLEVDKCDLKGKVEFPWSINDAFITDNLSRSEYLQNNLIKSFHLNIPYNIFRRQISLINNGLTTRSSIQLSPQSFKCYSDILPFNKLMLNLTESGYWTGEEYFYTEWTCKLPFEFQGRAVLRLKAEETYSVVNITDCPPLCECYIREMFNVTIVNCRDKELNTLPENMPSGMLDIWLENNNISKLTVRKYLGNIRQLLISNNNLGEIEPDALKKMINIKRLTLDNNLLMHIPENIKDLDIDAISLQNNLFACDCNSLWFKKWLTVNIDLIENIHDITCHSENNAQPIVLLHDNKFVCHDRTVHQSYVIPVVVGILLTFIALFLGFYFRVEIKVLIYVTFELHPFDRQKCDKREIIDLTIIHAKDSSEFVEEKLVFPLKQMQFVVFSVANDFVAGYSLQENVSSAVLQSKHVLLILSDEMFANTVLMDYTWAECQNKIKVNRANFLLVTSVTENNVVTALNKDVQKYIKLHKHLKYRNALFLSKIKYTLRSYSKNNLGASQDNLMVNMNTNIVFPFERELKITKGHEYDLFFCYSCDERDYCQNNLIPRLERESYRICTPDSHFHPGACILTNIGLAVESSSHTIFVTSSLETLDDLQLFAFQRAIEKTRLSKYNHLIVIFLQDKTSKIDDRDIKDYLNSYVYLDVTDRNFMAKLKNALMPQIKVKLSDTYIIIRNGVT